MSYKERCGEKDPQKPEVYKVNLYSTKMYLQRTQKMIAGIVNLTRGRLACTSIIKVDHTVPWLFDLSCFPGLLITGYFDVNTQTKVKS